MCRLPSFWAACFSPVFVLLSRQRFCIASLRFRAHLSIMLCVNVCIVSRLKRLQSCALELWIAVDADHLGSVPTELNMAKARERSTRRICRTKGEERRGLSERAFPSKFHRAAALLHCCWQKSDSFRWKSHAKLRQTLCSAAFHTLLASADVHVIHR